MIHINAKQLADALTLVAGAVDRRSTIPILSNVRIDGDWRRGSLKVECTDLDVALAVTLPAEVLAEVHLTVPARELLKFTKTIDKGVTLKMQAKGASTLTIDAAGMVADFSGYSAENWPDAPAVPSPSAMIPSDVMADALRKTSFAVATDESRYTLIGSLFEIQGDDLTVCATDGHRLSHYKAQRGTVASTADFRGLLPSKALKLIAKTLKRAKGAEVQFSADAKTPRRLKPTRPKAGAELRRCKVMRSARSATHG